MVFGANNKAIEERRLTFILTDGGEGTYKTNGDLIFSVSRTKLTLFHAFEMYVSQFPWYYCMKATYRSHRGEYARLATKLLVV